jgi:hypothetical protein
MDGRWSGRGNEECGAWYIGFVLQQTITLSRKGLAPDYGGVLGVFPKNPKRPIPPHTASMPKLVGTATIYPLV